MKSWQALSEADLAVTYLQATGGAERMPESAQALVDSVRAWLRRSRLDHRLGDAIDIAIEVFEISRQIRAQVPSQDDEATYLANVHEGTMADDEALQRAEELALAGRVSQMSQAEFAEFRRQAGIQQDLGAFLAGQQ